MATTANPAMYARYTLLLAAATVLLTWARALPIAGEVVASAVCASIGGFMTLQMITYVGRDLRWDMTDGLELKQLRKRAKKAGISKAEIERVAPRVAAEKVGGKAKKQAKQKAKAMNELRKNAAKVKPERVAALDAVDPKWRGD